MKFTEAQERAIASEAPRTCVRAGAGSGKTGVLVERIVRLIADGTTSLDRIVAITFTEKAALEMKERVRRKCRERAPQDSKDRLSFWRAAERSVSHARITTIHAFCRGVLREHALHLGEDPDFALLEDADAHLLLHETVLDGLLKLLRDENADAELVAGELGFDRTASSLRRLLLAGDETARALEHMGDGTPEAVQTAWRELEEKIKQQAVLYVRADPRIAEFGDAMKDLAGYCDDPADPREVMRLDVIAETERLAKVQTYNDIQAAYDRISARAKPAKKENWRSQDVKDKINKQRTKLKDLLKKHYLWDALPEDARTEAAELTAAFLRLYGRLAGKYTEAKNARTANDFEDLIMRAYNVLDHDEVVCKRVAHSISHLLIDEFQDTDGRQYDIAKKLCGVPGGPSLFIVGDAKQSIYLFRGAEVETFRSAQSEAETVVPLSENFRSLPDVLGFVNDFFESTQRLSVVEPDYGPLEANRTDTGETRIEFLTPDAPDANLADLRVAEADLMAARIHEMIESGRTVVERGADGETSRPVRYGDVAILLRAMSDVSVYEQALRRAGVPFTVVSGAGFYERQEIRDLRNLFAVVADPADEMALLAFLRSPLAALSDESLARMTGVLSGHQLSLSQFVASDRPLPDAEQNARLARARALLSDLYARRAQSAPELLRFVLQETGYEGMLLRQDFLGEQRAANVRKLVALADAFAQSRSPGLVQFLRYLEDIVRTDIREGEALELSPDRNAVTIMTIHQSKGLEFPVVLLADTGRKSRGHSDGPVKLHRHLGVAVRAKEPKKSQPSPAPFACIENLRAWQDQAESARLLYVAMTRARDYLFIAGPTGRPDDTWMRGFDRWLGLAARRHDERIDGKSWRGVVRRKPPKTARKQGGEAPQPAPDRPAVARRIAPIANVRLAPQVSITALAAALAGAEEDRAPTTSHGHSYPLIRGSVAHRLFQLWDFAADRHPDIAALLHGEPLDAAARAQLESELQTMAKRFRDSATFRQLQAAPPVERELALRWTVDAFTINGVIDALLADGTVLDYKTGQKNDTTAAQYTWQLRLYGAALRALSDSPAPRGMLCYVDVDSTPCVEETFDDTLLNDTLERVRAVLPRFREAV